MTKRELLLLGLLGLLVVLVVAAFQQDPGYMDADYYLASGLQLASGKGFSEPYLWNYLDDPIGLPHPSHTYWMPLASIMAALIPGLTGIESWWTGRIPFILAAACVPPLTAALAYEFSMRRSLAICSGLLAVFAGFYLPFLPTTDTFTLYMLLGGLFFLLLHRQKNQQRPRFRDSISLGLLAGLMHLSRADGLLWLFVAFAVCWLTASPSSGDRHRLKTFLVGSCTTLMGYLLVMGPWFVRNLAAFGSILAPGGSKMFWLTSYDQIFSYPAAGLTFEAWLHSGIGAILQVRLWALGLNLATMLTVQGGVFLLPFILIGIRQLRREKVIRIGSLAWGLMFLAMTLAFPFAGARGGFFHAGAAFQILWWAVAPIGLEEAIRWISTRRGWHEANAQSVFRAGVIGLTVFLTIGVLFSRLPGWGDEAARYRLIDNYLRSKGLSTSEVVIVANPPGYHLISSNPAIAVPFGTPETILALAECYHARYLILEWGSVPSGLLPVYDAPEEYPELAYLGDVEGAHVYAIQP